MEVLYFNNKLRNRNPDGTTCQAVSGVALGPDLFQSIFSVRRLALQNLLAVLLQLGLHCLVSIILSTKKDNYLLKNLSTCLRRAQLLRG